MILITRLDVLDEELVIIGSVKTGKEAHKLIMRDYGKYKNKYKLYDLELNVKPSEVTVKNTYKVLIIKYKITSVPEGILLNIGDF